MQEECGEWANRTVEVASITEDAAAINEMHDAVLGKTLFAVDAPDGESNLFSAAPNSHVVMCCVSRSTDMYTG